MKPGTRRWPPAFLTRISTRLLAFNLLIVFLPIGALLYLDTYERQLLRALEHALVQQARVLAAALSGADSLDGTAARRVLVELQQRQEARLRVLDAQGQLLADSSRLGPLRADAAAPSADSPVDSPADSPLYRLASAPVRLYRRLFRPPEPPLDSAEYYVGADRLLGPEIQEALAGRYGALTRISTGGQRSVTLYSAIPVRGRSLGGTEAPVVGAVLASQSTYRILRDLYELRLQIFVILLAAIAAAVILSLVAATTIVGPLGRLQRQAREILDHRGRLRGHFRPPRRRDEIGDLSRALHELTRSAEQRLRFMESFASDLSHELKNPLATIRSAAEILAQAQSDSDRRRFTALIQQEVARTEALASAVREISRIDTQLEQEERQLLDIGEVAERAVESLRLRVGAPPAAFRVEPLAPGGGAGERRPTVTMSPTRAVQMLENLLDNAASFSPREVTVEVGREDEVVRIRVLDRGPGIPEANLERIFDRFFTFRPEPSAPRAPGGAAEAPPRDKHLGLGLAIVKAIAEGHDGSVRAENREGGGAVFEVLLLAADR